MKEKRREGENKGIEGQIHETYGSLFSAVAGKKSNKKMYSFLIIVLFLMLQLLFYKSGQEEETYV